MPPAQKDAGPKGVRFPPELLARIEDRAARTGRSFNWIVAQLVEQALAEERAGGAVTIDWVSIGEVEHRLEQISENARFISTTLGQATSRAVPRAEGQPAAQTTGHEALVMPFPAANPNVDEPRDLHETEMEIVAYAAAGQDRHPEPVATGETVPVINHVFRKAQRGKWKVVKVVGDSMAPEYEPGDMVLIEPARDSTVRTGDVAFVMLNGEGLLKVLDFKRDRDTGRLLELRLRSLNQGFQDIPVGEGDWFHVIGVEAYRIQGKRNFR